MKKKIVFSYVYGRVIFEKKLYYKHLNPNQA